MPDQIERVLRRLEAQLPGRLSLPGGDGYAAATAIWAKPVGPMPRAVGHFWMSISRLSIARARARERQVFRRSRAGSPNARRRDKRADRLAKIKELFTKIMRLS